MKVLLLEHPRQIAQERCNDIANTPLSSCLLTGYAAAMLRREGHGVEIVEGYLDRLSYADIRGAIDAFRPDLLGVHMVYHWRADLELFGFLGQMKSEGLAPLIAAYGFYPTTAYPDILRQCAAIDAVIVGEPEIPFAELCRTSAMETEFSRIPGVAARSNGTIVCSGKNPAWDLDSLPFPVRTEALYRLPEVNLLGSRGCYGRCSFCSINTFYGSGTPWRRRSPENIAAEIDQVIAGRGMRDFYFTDPNFFGPGKPGQERALRIAGLLKERKIRFGIEGRVNDIHDEVIGPLVEAGLRHILIGLESGRDEALRRMNKMTTVAENERALAVLRRHGIEPNVGFIMFEPDSMLADIRTNFEFLKRNDLLKNLPVTANVLYHHQIILGGTPAYHTLKAEGRLVLEGPSYEGTAYFRAPAVAALAAIMRDVTNFLFSAMAGIWSGTVIAPPDSRKRYGRVNGLLVQVFEESLSALESGERFDAERIAAVARAAEQAIGETLLQPAPL